MVLYFFSYFFFSFCWFMVVLGIYMYGAIFIPKFKWKSTFIRSGIFLGGEFKIYKKSVSIKLWPPISATNILWPPPITDTHYPLNRLKLYWNQYFWTKQTHCMWSSCDSLHYGHQKFYDPPIFLSKNLWSPVYLRPPFQRECQPPKLTPLCPQTIVKSSVSFLSVIK